MSRFLRGSEICVLVFFTVPLQFRTADFQILNSHLFCSKDVGRSEDIPIATFVYNRLTTILHCLSQKGTIN